MVQLHVEGLLSSGPEFLKASLGANDSEMVSGFCFKAESHVHSVYGTLLFKSSKFYVELQCQDNDASKLCDIECKVEENANGKNREMATDDSDEDFPYFLQSDGDKPVEFRFGSGEINLSMPGSSSNINEANHEAVDHIFIEEQFVEDLDSKNNQTKKIHKLEKVDLTLYKGDKKHQIYDCQKCPESFSNRNTFVNHCSTIHSVPVNHVFDCNICGKICKELYILKMHQSSIHGIEVQPITRDLCQHISPTRANHNYHMKAKHSEIPLVCNLCGKSFSVRSSLNRHIRSHAGVKAPKLLCPICGVCLSRPDYLKAHIKVHTDGPNAHKCDECCAVFPSFWKLRSHRQHHRFVKVFNHSFNADPLP